MREPAFWYGPPSFLSRLLTPAGALYGMITARRMAKPGSRAGIPVICIGNYHTGGAGKTPTTIALAKLLRELKERPFVVSRGYGGRLRGPVRVDMALHTAADVGDEPLMMAASIPVIVSRDRVAGAALARSSGATVILLDDGFQNPALHKDVSLVVIDGKRGLGNASVFPAGPLRAPLESQISHTDALVVVGSGSSADGVVAAIGAKDGAVFRSHLQASEASLAAWRGKRVLAFAGIGDPARFFSTLRSSEIDVVETKTFDDHHAFTSAEIEALVADADAKSLTPVTTEKDMTRIRSDTRLTKYVKSIVPFAVTLEFNAPDELRAFVVDRLAKARS